MGTTRAGARAGVTVHKNAMIGDDARGRARARARATVNKNAMIEDDARGRARARARATVHKNTMIEDDARGRARAGVTMHKNFKKVKIGKSMIFKNKSVFLDPH